MNVREKLKFLVASKCYLCGGPFSPQNHKVIDHDHLDGKIRGVAHNECNLKAKKQYQLPIFFHNLFGYDIHLLIRELVTAIPGKFEVIAKNSEKYIMLSVKSQGVRMKLMFLDSYNFMADKLENLASLLPEEDRDIIKKAHPLHSTLLLGKMNFPYEYVRNWEVLEERTLPPLEKFHSTLTGETITQEEYQRTQHIWQTFKLQRIGELSDLYLQIDVLLLAIVFEKFRKHCLKIYKLDPTHYFTTPSLSWDAMLKFTRVKLELIRKIDMYLFFEAGIRGGFAAAIKRYAQSNHPYLRDYKPELPLRHIIYWDFVNLYGGVIEKPLPYGNFRWLKDCRSFDVFADSNPKFGHVLEVDLEIPQHLHDVLRDLPPLLTHELVKKESKLLGTLCNKEKYIIHAENLKFVLTLGIQLRRVHRVLRFRQKPF